MACARGDSGRESHERETDPRDEEPDKHHFSEENACSSRTWVRMGSATVAGRSTSRYVPSARRASLFAIIHVMATASVNLMSFTGLLNPRRWVACAASCAGVMTAPSAAAEA